VGSANIVLYDDDDNSIADLVLNPGLKTEVSRPCPGGRGPSLALVHSNHSGTRIAHGTSILLHRPRKMINVYNPGPASSLRALQAETRHD
jgi:hypothetical protein